MKFVGRKEELKRLERVYREHGSTLSLIMGRRRIGKTFLAKEFVRNKPVMFFEPEKDGIVEDNIKRFLASLEEFTVYLKNGKIPETSVSEVFDNIPDNPVYVYRRIESLFREISSYPEKPIIYIDEFPRLCRLNKLLDFPSLIQAFLDQTKGEQHGIHFLVVGSSASMMERLFFTGSSPLYGRADDVIFLRGFNIEEITEMLSKEGVVPRNDLFLVDLISLIDGIPYYLKIITSTLKEGTNDELFRAFMKNLEIFKEERHLVFQEEEKLAELFFKIIDVIGKKQLKIDEISQKVKISKQKTKKLLDILKKLGIIGEVHVALSAKNFRERYVLIDPLLRMILVFRGVEHLHSAFENVPFLISRLLEQTVGQNYEIIWQNEIRKIASILGFRYGKAELKSYTRDRNAKGEIDGILVKGKSNPELLGIVEIKRTFNKRDIEDTIQKAERLIHTSQFSKIKKPLPIFMLGVPQKDLELEEIQSLCIDFTIKHATLPNNAFLETFLTVVDEG